ncbi:hypothetical protein [Streptomyces sp. B6B3]|uniref:hypothetical protein n=1 Tax=Streptomyces sp. B6B3 TaxID=3153570 RepID=UPI00325DBF5E
MSSPYPQHQPSPYQNQHQPQAQAAGPPSYPGPYPQSDPPRHGGPPAPPPAGRSKRPKVILAIVAALVLVAGAVGAWLVLLGGGGPDRPEMATHDDLSELPFPDAGALSYEEGVDAHCAAVEELMAARGYVLLGTEEGNGISCILGAPGTSQLEDGSLSLSVQVALTRGGGARSAYDAYLESTVNGRENLADDTTFTFSELYDFPSGEEGFLSQSEWSRGPSGSATAGFRSGDDTFFVYLSGSVNHVDEDTPNEPLPMDLTRQELVDIVKTLGGDESAGEPRITQAEMAEYPDLPELTEPRLADGDSPVARCAAVTSFAEGLGSDVEDLSFGTSSPALTQCHYSLGVDNARFGENGLPHYRVEVHEYDYSDASENLFPTEDLGSDLQTIMAEPENPALEGDEVILGELYELPVGESGYMIHSRSEGEYSSGFSTEVRAGYVVGNGDIYVSIRLTGGEYGANGFEGYGEDALIPVLADLLTAMDA